MPDPVEGRIDHIVGAAHRLQIDGPVPIERLPDEEASLRLLGPQAERRPLGLVGVVVDERVPQIESHCLDHTIGSPCEGAVGAYPIRAALRYPHSRMSNRKPNSAASTTAITAVEKAAACA
jgi:hypothetical protein